MSGPIVVPSSLPGRMRRGTARTLPFRTKGASLARIEK